MFHLDKSQEQAACQKVLRKNLSKCPRIYASWAAQILNWHSGKLAAPCEWRAVIGGGGVNLSAPFASSKKEAKMFPLS